MTNYALYRSCNGRFVLLCLGFVMRTKLNAFDNGRFADMTTLKYTKLDIYSQHHFFYAIELIIDEGSNWNGSTEGEISKKPTAQQWRGSMPSFRANIVSILRWCWQFPRITTCIIWWFIVVSIVVVKNNNSMPQKSHRSAIVKSFADWFAKAQNPKTGQNYVFFAVELVPALRDHFEPLRPTDRLQSAPL